MSAPDLDAACRACGGGSFPVRTFDRDGGVLLRRCAACRSEFLHPQPPDGRLAAEYADYGVRRKGTAPGGKTPYFRDLLAALGLPAGIGSIADLGAAEGDALRAAREIWPGARRLAVEPRPEGLTGTDCETARTSVEEWLAAPSGERFDLVLALDVLEHLRDPGEAVTRLARDRIAPGGFLVATFPNGTSLSRRWMGRLWVQWRIEHLHYLSAAGVLALARNASLDTGFLAPHTKRLPVSYLLAVGSRFGPAPVRPLVRFLARTTPGLLARRSVGLPLGEWIWVARRRA